MTRSGDVIATTNSSADVYRLRASVDDVIYAACWINGVYQSEDDGVTWSHLFTYCDTDMWLAIKMFSDTNADVFYVLGRHNGEWHLHQYTIWINEQSVNSVTCRDLALHSDLVRFPSMAFDGRSKVVVSNLNEASNFNVCFVHVNKQ